MTERRDSIGLVVTRGFAIAGVALVVGLTHAMVSKVSVTADDARATRAAELAMVVDEAAEVLESAPTAGDVGGDVDALAMPAESDGLGAGNTPESAEAVVGVDGDAGGSIAAMDFSALGEEITLEETHALIASGEVHVIDARTRDEFVEGHLPGAMWLPADQLGSGDKPMAFYMLTYELPIVIYCGGGDCEASHNVATRLLLEGFERTHVFLDGYPAWVDAGHEVSVGPDPLWEGE